MELGSLAGVFIEERRVYVYVFIWEMLSSSDEKKYGSVSDRKRVIKERGHFTNTEVPRFDGMGCWQQHLQIVQAIVKSN